MEKQIVMWKDRQLCGKRDSYVETYVDSYVERQIVMWKDRQLYGKIDSYVERYVEQKDRLKQEAVDYLLFVEVNC